MYQQKPIKIIIFGKTGSGKSTFLNWLAGRELFTVSNSYKSCTKKCQMEKVNVNGVTFELIDTPGFFDDEDMDIEEKIRSYIITLSEGINFAFLAFPIDTTRFDSNYKDMFKIVESLLGKKVFPYMAILLTKIDALAPIYEEKRKRIVFTELLAKMKTHQLGPYHDKIFHYKLENSTTSMVQELELKNKRIVPKIYKTLKRKGITINNELNDEEMNNALKEYKELSNTEIALLLISVSLIYTGATVGTGALIGSVLGPAGTLIGGVIGGLYENSTTSMVQELELKNKRIVPKIYKTLKRKGITINNELNDEEMNNALKEYKELSNTEIALLLISVSLIYTGATVGTGALIGSVLGPAGTLIGGVIGGLYAKLPITIGLTLPPLLLTITMYISPESATAMTDWNHILGLILIILGICLSQTAGVGGGGLFLPILLLCFELQQSHATAMSNCMICVSCLFRYILTYKLRHPVRDKPLVDYDIVILILPWVIMGTRIGVIIHFLCPKVVMLILLGILLLLTGANLLKKGFKLLVQERHIKYEEHSIVQETLGESNSVELLGGVPPEIEMENRSRITDHNKHRPQTHTEHALEIIEMEERKYVPLQKIGFVLVPVISLIILLLIQGSKDMKSIFNVAICSFTYWAAFIIFIAFNLFWSYLMYSHIQRAHEAKLKANYQFGVGDIYMDMGNIQKICGVGVIAGWIAGCFGLGGGIVFNPVLLELGVLPEVASATAIFMIIFGSGVATFQYVIVGELLYFTAVIICFAAVFATGFTLVYILKRVRAYGRNSIIIFALTFVIFASAILIPYFGIKRNLEGHKTWSQLLAFQSFCEQ